MLSYLIQTTTSLLMAAVMLGSLLAYTKTAAGVLGRNIVFSGLAAGLIASIVMSYFKNASNRIDMGMWNLGTFSVALLAYMGFLFFSLKRLSGLLGGVLPWIFLAVLSVTILFYALPDVWAYPYQMVSAGQSMLSTDFLYKFIGFVFGWILNIVLLFAVYECGIRISEKGAGLLLKLLLLVNAIRQLSVMLQILLAKRLIVSNHTLFLLAKNTSNHSDWFLYLSMILPFIVAVSLCIRSFRVSEPYANPAQHRKIRAKWRSVRRWSVTAAIAFFCCVMNMTVVKAYDSKVVELSPVEDAEIVDGNVLVPFEAVSDGHLHRFAYVTEAGTQIRFIVIQKPNSSSYGIGLDACDICGETGYYEKDGQVVCNLCDVVMNINTIGFKGGCNPIVIPYEISDGQIRVPVEGLMEHEKEFK